MYLYIMIKKKTHMDKHAHDDESTRIRGNWGALRNRRIAR
jgi:hypothetical protein